MNLKIHVHDSVTSTLRKKGKEGRRVEGIADLGSYSLRSSRSRASWTCPEICEEKIKALDKFLYLMLLVILNSSDFHHQETLTKV